MESLSEILNAHESFLLTTHAVPDGDGLGCEFAVAGILRALGKKAVVCNPDAIPKKYRFLDPSSEALVFDGALPASDAVLVLDTNELSMMNALGEEIQKSGRPVYFFDHHVAMPGAKGVLTDSSKGSTGEYLYDEVKKMGKEFPQEVYTAMYVALVSDGRSFLFRGLSESFHLCLADLIRRGVSSQEVYQKLFVRDSLSKVTLMGHVLSQIQNRKEGEIVWIEVPKKLRNEVGATIEDTEGFINPLTLIEGAKVGLLFREEEDGRIKVGMRALGQVDVLGIARKFGGGGHQYAAGARIPGTLKDVVSSVLNEVEQAIS